MFSYQHKLTVLVAVAVLCGLSAVVPLLPAEASMIHSEEIRLLEPLGDEDTVRIEVSGPGDGRVKTWLNYMGPAMEWVFNVAIGIAVLWVLIGGIMIMIAGDDASKRQNGIGMMKNAILGLVVLIFAGLILRMLNSLFFTTG